MTEHLWALPVAIGLIVLALGCGEEARTPTAEKASGVSLYVSTDGNDAWSGRLAEPNAAKTDGPFASITGARDAIRRLKATQGELTEPVNVFIRGGVYHVAETIVFTPEDSGAEGCPISYAAYRDEKPVLCGGRRITGLAPDGKGRLSVLLPDVKAGKWSFRSLFVDGARQIRARYPNVDPSDPHRKGFLYVDQVISGFGMGVGCIHNPGDWMEYDVTIPADGEYHCWVYYAALNKPFGNSDMAGRTALTVDGEPPIPLMNLPDTGGWNALRWSDSAMAQLKGGAHVLRWQNLKGGGLNLDAFALTDDGNWKPSGVKLPQPAAGKHLVVIQAEDFRTSQGKQLAISGTSGSKTEFRAKAGTFKRSWVSAPGAELHVFQSGSCRAFKEIVSIEKLDEATNTVTVGGPECVAPIGLGDRYFVENILEELDSPGEWYLDVASGVFYLQPPPGFTDKTEVIAPVAGRLIEFQGDAPNGNPVAHIRIVGLALQCTDYSPNDGCVGYGMGNDGVIYLSAATHCSVADCVFTNIGKYAVCVTGGGDNTISGNDISDSAEGGVLLLGSARNTVSDNHIHHCGAVYKHIGGVVIQGAGADDNTVSHNMIHDMSRYGISLKNAGGRNVIEFNRVHNTNTETYDTGGIEVTQHDKEFRSGSVIRYNIVGDTIGYSSQGEKPVYLSWSIYLDSFAGGYDVNNNVCYRNHDGGIMLQGGKDNKVTNNIFVDSEVRQGLISNFANNSTGQVMERNIFYYSKPDAVLYSTGKLTQEVIRIDNNLCFCAGGKEVRVGWGGKQSFAEWQQQGFDAHSIVADPKFADPAHDNYALQPDSPAFGLGFKAIDTSKIGLLRDRCRCRICPDKF